jgi:hypothetical protein
VFDPSKSKIRTFWKYYFGSKQSILDIASILVLIIAMNIEFCAKS